MTRFRSKPVEIEAVRLTKERMWDWRSAVEQEPPGIGWADEDTVVYCHTRQGVVKADLGDWIITESDGSGCYPCKPDVFENKYEPINT